MSQRLVIRKGRPLSVKSQCIIGALASGPKLCHEIAEAIGETDLHLLRANLLHLWHGQLLDRTTIPGKAGKPVLLYSVGTGASSVEPRTAQEIAELMGRQRKQRSPDDEPPAPKTGPNGGRYISFASEVRPSTPGQASDYRPRRASAILGE